MSLCRNCKQNISKYLCEVCNCSYCLRCDSYIHSFPSKRTHLRKYIPYNISDLNLLNNNIPYYSNNSNLNENNNNISNDYNDIRQEAKEEQVENFSNFKKYPEENDYNYNEEDQDQKNIFFYSQTKFEPKENKIKNEENNNEAEYDYELNDDLEKEIYSKKISNLGSEILDAKENFDNKIEDLHEYFHVINENQKIKMNEFNEKNLKEITMITSEKDIQIQRLKEIIEEQIEIINQLKDENNNLQNIYNENKKEMENINYDKQKLIEENKIKEEANIKKIDEIMKINEEEKMKLINDYNEELIKIKDKYNKTEEQFENTFKEKQNNLNDYIEEIDKEKKDLSIMINNLIIDNNNKNKETEKLKITNEELGKIFNDREGQYNSMKEVVSKGMRQKNK